MDSIRLRHPVEAIVVDDGSIDHSSRICAEYCDKSSIFKYMYQKNGGPGSARNRGIVHALGEYIMFLDSDDFIDCDALDVLLDSILVTKPDLIYYDFDQIDEKGHILRQHRFKNFTHMKKEELITSTLSWKLPWGQFKIIKRELITNNSIRFDEDKKDSEELIFTVTCLELARTILFSEQVVYKYVKRYNSLSTAHDAVSLFHSRQAIIAMLNDRYGYKFSTGVVNYSLVSHIQILKLLAEQSKGIEGYKFYKSMMKSKVNGLLKKANPAYLEYRYQILYRMLILRIDFLLYCAFRWNKR